MSSCYNMPPRNLRRKIVFPATFSTVLIPGQFYGEVPHEFCAQNYYDIGSVWHVVDKNGLKQPLAFNRHHRIPYLTNGWVTLLQHYRVEHAREVTFAYFGNGSFLITVGQVYSSTDEYPSFHSHSTKPTLTTYFDIVLTHYEATSSQLTLQKKFADFVLDTQDNSVMLCNQHLDIVLATILLKNGTKSTTKFGSGWREFCRMQRYKEGDTIRFKFAPTPMSNLVHVRKLR